MLRVEEVRQALICLTFVAIERQELRRSLLRGSFEEEVWTMKCE